MLTLTITFYHYKVKTLENTRDKALNHIESLQNLINQQNAGILSLKQAAETQQKKLLQAQEKAKNQAAFYAGQADSILAANVSSECEKAIEWGTEQGVILSNDWQKS